VKIVTPIRLARNISKTAEGAI